MELSYQFGISSAPLKGYDFNESYSDKLKDLTELKDAQAIITIGRHYLQNFIPSPIENEDEYWMCSCYPGNDNIPIRFNINWHEVLSIQESDNSDESNLKWELSIFTHKDYLSTEIIEKLKEGISGLKFDESITYKKGLSSQLVAIIPIESYFDFIANENVYESIRQYNYQLSCKGRRVHNGHNYELARLLIQGRFGTGLIKPIKPTSNQKAYIFVWNPKTWPWDDIEDYIEQRENYGTVEITWKCGNTKSIAVDDRIFLIKLGTKPKGIIASGYALSEPYIDENDGSLYIRIELEILFNPEIDEIFPIEELQTGSLAKQGSWTPQASGINIKSEIIEDLEKKWTGFLEKQRIFYTSSTSTIIQDIHTEGTVTQILQNRYERNPQARKACIDHYGSSCVVCEFNFEETYGDIGKNFIHVHHLIQVSTRKEVYEVNPIKDLVPVCPNCHAMFHKRNPPLTIEELKELIK